MYLYWRLVCYKTKQYFFCYNFDHYSITELSANIKHINEISCYTIGSITDLSTNRKHINKISYCTYCPYYMETLVNMINNYMQFISNNVKGLQSLKKRTKVFEYLKKLHLQ